LPSLQAFAAPGHILYGSDFPYAPAAIGAAFTAKLDAYQHISKAERDAINSGSAIALFDGLPRQSHEAQSDLMLLHPRMCRVRAPGHRRPA
jgi:hypothetical protein